MSEDLTEAIISTLKDVLSVPPLKTQQIPDEPVSEPTLKRSKRRSKFTAEQDAQIVELKKKGMAWVDIAKTTGVGSFLAARNRYQVLMGQQGVASTVWDAQDTRCLQGLIDEGEMEKWRFIAREMYKLTGKFFTDVQCRELVRDLFMANPGDFGVDEEVLKEY